MFKDSMPRIVVGTLEYGKMRHQIISIFTRPVIEIRKQDFVYFEDRLVINRFFLAK